MPVSGFLEATAALEDEGFAALEEEAGGFFLEDTACLEDVFPAEEVEVLELAGKSDEADAAELSKALTSSGELVREDMGSLETAGKELPVPCGERPKEQPLSSSAPVRSATANADKVFFIDMNVSFLLFEWYCFWL